MRSKKNIKKLINTGKHFCIMPWIHLHVTGLGYMVPCCGVKKGPYSRGYGNLNNKSLHELWQGESIKNFRLKMLNDEPDSRCILCYKQEKIDNWSLRSLHNKKFAEKHIDCLISTDKEGYAPDAKPIYWDIRFSNLCNLKCRTCSYTASSNWYDDSKSLAPVNTKNKSKVIIGLKNTSKLLMELEPYFPFIEKIMFAGGEPLLIEENFRILERLDLLSKYDNELYYITNMTKLKYKNQSILSKWKNFKNLFVSISLDGIGKKCKYLRKGLKWDKVLENLKLFKTKCPDANFNINYTLSVFNALHVVDFHKELVENGYIKADQINLIYLNEPEYYSPKIMPSNMKELVKKKIEKHIKWLKSQVPYNNEENLLNYKESFYQWENFVKYIYSEDLTNIIPKFIRITNKLDNLRNEKCLEIFPELQPLFQNT